MLPASQKLVEGVELRAVTHVLVHVQDLCQDATTQTHTFLPQRATLQVKCEKNGSWLRPIRDFFFKLFIKFGFCCEEILSTCFLFTWLQHMSIQPFIQRQGQILTRISYLEMCGEYSKGISPTARGPVVLYRQLVLPVPRHRGVPRADVRVTRQHFEGGRLSSSVNSQQTEALLAQKSN